MIFALYPRVAVKLGDERHEVEVGRLMFRDAAEIERVTGQSYAEWYAALNDHKITAIAALLHVLRKRDGQPSDFAAMDFAALELDVVPLHDDGTEYSAEEVRADIERRVREAQAPAEPVPTLAADGQGNPSGVTALTRQKPTSRRSPASSASGRGSGSGSRTGTG